MYTLKLTLGIVAMLVAVVGAMLLLNSEPTRAAARAGLTASGMTVHAMHATSDSGKAHSGCPMMSGDTSMHHGDSGKAGHGCCMMGGNDGNMSMDHSNGSAHGDHATHAGATSAKAYAFSAVVKKVDIANKRIVLQHENIGDYMMAMTMPFAVKDVALIKDLKVDDQRFFVLQVDGDRAQIIAVKLTRADADKVANGGSPGGNAHGAGKAHGCGM